VKTPRSASSPPSPAVPKTRARPRSFPFLWAFPYFFLVFHSLLGLFHPEEAWWRVWPLWFAVGLMLLASFADVRHWMHRRRQFQQHPNEPWLWERSWRRELRPLVRWEDYLGPLLVILFLLGLTSSVLFSLYRFGGLILVSIAVAILLAVGFMAAAEGLFSKLRQMVRELRPGQPSLRLPEIPLALGTRSQLHVVARPGLPAVNTVTVRLRRVRERDERVGSGDQARTKVHRTIEYEREHAVDATALREGRDLPLPLEWPDAGADNSTVWRGPLRCFWDLQLIFDGSDSSSTYRLPVYHSVGENPGGLVR